MEESDDYTESDGDCEPDDISCNWLESTSGKKDDDLGDKSFSINLKNDKCNDDYCQVMATGLGISATAVDATAFILNLGFAGAAIIGGEGYFVVAGLYQIAGPMINAYGAVGSGLWAAQGYMLGQNSIDVNITFNANNQLKQLRVSGSVGQDTIISTSLDGLGLYNKEPIMGAGISGAGLAYDIFRNPLAPYASSAPPIIPTYVQPHGSFTINFSNSSLTANGSLFP
jgi:hypothetical protein